MSSNNIIFEPFPKQQEFIDAVFSGEHSVLLYGGAIRGGKTFVGLAILLLLARIYPNSRWAVVRTDIKRIKSTTLPSFLKICPDKPFLVYKNETTHCYRFSNGSEILFFGENYDKDKELNRWKGLEVNGFLLEEINELQEISLTKAIERAGSQILFNMPKPLIICTCNPTQNWVKQKFYDKFMNGTLDKGYFYLPAKITDNPHVPLEYLESLKNMPAKQYMMFVEGLWDITIKEGNEFYSDFDIDKHVGDYAYNPNLPLHITFDENVLPYLPVSVWQIPNEKEAWQVMEFAMPPPKNKLESVCDAILQRYKNHNAGLFIYGDATSQKEDVKLEKGHNLFSLIKQKLNILHPQMKLSRSNPSVIMRGEFINYCFATDQTIKIRIDKSCIATINDLNGTQKDKNGAKDKAMVTVKGMRYQKYGHLSDAMDYFLCKAWEQDYNKFVRGGKDATFYTGTIIKNNRR